MAIACPNCGALENLPRLTHGQLARCYVCEAPLEVTHGRSVAAGLACALTMAILLIPANLAPLLRVSLLGRSREIWLSSGIPVLFYHQWLLLALAVAVFVIVLPFVRASLLIAVFANVLLRLRPRWLGRAFRWALWLTPWAMPEVFLIAAAIGYARVAAETPVQVGAGGYCFIAAALLSMLTHSAANERVVWRIIRPEAPVPSGRIISCSTCDYVCEASVSRTPCPRCGATLRARTPNALTYTLALVAASFVLYLPSNILPMSITDQATGKMSHTIFTGIEDLFRAGLAPLGVLIFFTSIAIPLLKLLGLSWLMVSVWQRSTVRLKPKGRLLRLIRVIGHWSNVDPFTLAVIVPLFQFPPLVSSHAGPGAISFLMVVVLTMAATRIFDPRLMWDAATLSDRPS